MKKLIYGFFMSWGMFCSIPCPCKIWDEEARPMSLVCFPLIGTLMGALWVLIGFIVTKLNIGFLGAAVMAVFPYLVTGFIHLDGYMDCCDAILSRRDLAERQRIMKDSHTGAFAVICVCVLMMLSFASFAQIDLNTKFKALLFIPVATRACAAIAVMSLRPLGHSQYAVALNKRVKTGHKIAAVVLLVAAIALSVVCFGKAGICAAFAAAGYAIAAFYGFKQLDGMSGDISGYALTVGECVGVVALCVI